MLFNKPTPKRQALHVKKGDKVVVTSGQYRSDELRDVLKVDADERRITDGDDNHGGWAIYETD